MIFGGRFWNMGVSDEADPNGMHLHEAAHQHGPRRRMTDHNPPPQIPTPFSMARLAELAIPVIVASGMTGLVTVAVLGEQIKGLRDNQEGMQQDLREMRRDLYQPRLNDLRWTPRPHRDTHTKGPI